MIWTDSLCVYSIVCCTSTPRFARALDALELVVDVARLETADAKARGVDAPLTKALGVALPVLVDWSSFEEDGAYLAMPARDRYSVVVRLRTTVPARLLVGDEGLTGRKGMAEFKEVVAAFLVQTNSVVIRCGGAACSLDDSGVLVLQVPSAVALQCSGSTSDDVLGGALVVILVAVHTSAH